LPNRTQFAESNQISAVSALPLARRNLPRYLRWVFFWARSPWWAPRTHIADIGRPTAQRLEAQFKGLQGGRQAGHRRARVGSI